MQGIVYLIGAGPGNPGLLTLRGAELLGKADVVLYDGLSNADLLCHAPTAEHVCVGKHGQSRIWRQDEIIAEIVRHARAGKRVARLKGGDPAVFARTAEEVLALRQAEISFEIVPGITAALAAGSFAGIPITHRGIASAVALVTGHEEPGKDESALDWNALARFPGTLVIYMGVTTAGTWSRALIHAGKSADTPAAIVRRCSMPDQQTIHCRLHEVALKIESNRIRPPAIVILGLVTELATTMNWIQDRPLFGKTILVTRAVHQADSLAAPLHDLGATVLLQPAIEIGAPASWLDVDAAIKNLSDFDTIVFCSHNGVHYFMDRLLDSGADVRRVGNAKLAVVGGKTAESLRHYSLNPDIVPKDFRAESLADQMCPSISGKRVLIVRASRGRDILADAISQAGGVVTQVIAYNHQDVTSPDAKIHKLLADGQIDWVIVMSSASGASLAKMFGESLLKAKIASISSITTRSLNELGYQVTLEANPSTIESLIDQIQRANS